MFVSMGYHFKRQRKKEKKSERDLNQNSFTFEQRPASQLKMSRPTMYVPCILYKIYMFRKLILHTVPNLTFTQETRSSLSPRFGFHFFISRQRLWIISHKFICQMSSHVSNHPTRARVTEYRIPNLIYILHYTVVETVWTMDLQSTTTSIQ